MWADSRIQCSLRWLHDDTFEEIGGEMKIRFVSRNEYKLAEARVILDKVGIDIVPLKQTIEELQTIDASRLVRDKAFRAFSRIGRPLFVEHTGLRLREIGRASCRERGWMM